MFKRIGFVALLFAALTAGAAGDNWVERMYDTYIIDEVYTSSRDLLTVLSDTSTPRQPWVERMAATYIKLLAPPVNITAEIEESGVRLSLFKSLSRTPLEAQMWVEAMAQTYITKEMGLSNSSAIFHHLSQTPAASQPWVKHMAHTYIPGASDASSSRMILGILRETPPLHHAWVERLAGIYITPAVKQEERACMVIFMSFTNLSPASYEWLEHLMAFCVNPIDHPRNIVLNIASLANLARTLPTPQLLEQARIRVMAGVNQAREEGLRGETFEEHLSRLTTRIRDELTQQADMNPGAARPMGLAMEVHFASALQVPSEDGRAVPLYKAVESRLHSLGIGNDMILAEAVSRVQRWIDGYADEDKRELYHQVVTKGYGDGSNPSYNQEITPLLRFVVPYMNGLSVEVQKSWLLPALQESATAYDEGDPLSCAKGVQERLTVVGLDVEGVDPILRSLSKYARDYLYIVDPTTYGADTWVKDVVKHLTRAERSSLLGAEKPQEEIFNAMFERALSTGIQGTGLLPPHTEALLNNPHVQGRFKESLEMHYGYAEHYQGLQTRVRALQTPEEQRLLVLQATERRLAPARRDLSEDRGGADAA